MNEAHAHSARKLSVMGFRMLGFAALNVYGSNIDWRLVLWYLAGVCAGRRLVLQSRHRVRYPLASVCVEDDLDLVGEDVRPSAGILEVGSARQRETYHHCLFLWANGKSTSL